MSCIPSESSLVVEEDGKELPNPSQPPFLEVHCKSCGKVWRFACGTDAGFAVYLINSKLGFGVPPALYIEASKEGQEPIIFGPKATLVNYGEGWKLQTAIEGGYEAASQNKQIPKIPSQICLTGNPAAPGSDSRISFQYIARIMIVFALMFLLGGVLVVFLENLPLMIELVTSS